MPYLDLNSANSIVCIQRKESFQKNSVTYIVLCGCVHNGVKDITYLASTVVLDRFFSQADITSHLSWHENKVNIIRLNVFLRILYWYLLKCEGQHLQVVLVKQSVAFTSYVNTNDSEHN